MVVNGSREKKMFQPGVDGYRRKIKKT